MKLYLLGILLLFLLMLMSMLFFVVALICSPEAALSPLSD